MANDKKKDKSKLSKRELQVLEAVAKGMSNQEIGRELVISENTVRVHLRKIYAKLEVQSRTEATMKGIQIGIIELPAGDLGAPAAAISAPVARPKPVVLARWQMVYFAGAITAAILVLLTPYWRRTVNPPVHSSILDVPATSAAPAVAPPENQWQLRSQMPTARSRLGVAGYNGNLYLIGGERKSGTTGLVEIYTPDTQQWREGASKPTAVANVQTIVIGDEIFVPGGCTGEQDAIAIFEVYNPAKDMWRTAAPLPTTRCAYAAAAFNGKLYLFGGWDGSNYVADGLVYSPEDDAWQPLPNPYPLAVGFSAAATLGNDIFVAGGYDGKKETTAVNRFNPEAAEWSSVPAMSYPRGGLGLVSLGDALYAVGGGWTSMVTANEKFSLQNGRWSDIPTPYAGEWRNLGLTTINREIFAVGGWNGNYLAGVLSYKTVYKVFIPLSY